jgi:hypothetical protein
VPGCFQPFARHQVHQPEAAGIVEHHPHARRHVKDHVVVGLQLARRTVGGGGDPNHVVRFDAERTRHAEMGDEHAAIVEIGEQILGAPAKGDHPAPGETGDEARRKGNAQIAPPLLDAHEGGALHDHGEAAADRLDFRQFGQPLTLCKGAAR